MDGQNPEGSRKKYPVPICTLPGRDYAVGWIVGERPWTGGKVLSHNGSNTMWLAVMWVAPAKDATFVVATNVAGTDADQGCGEVVSPMIQKLLR